MKFPRIYDEYNRLQCKSCKIFQSKSGYYQHSADGRFKNLDDHVCKKCHLASATADRSRAAARKKYHCDPEHRARQIANVKRRYQERKVEINIRKRAMWLARKYGLALNNRETRKTSGE